MDQLSGGSPFLYLHSFEPHLPDVTGSYAGDIARMDSELGRFLEAVQRRNALIIVFSDHGEDPSRASRRHGFDLKQDLLSVPLIVRDGLHAGVVSDPAQLVDLMPTILEFVDVRIPGSVQGRSLLPALRGERLQSTLIVSEAPFQGSSWFSARRGEFKLVFRPVEDSSSDLWWWDEVTGPQIALYNLRLTPMRSPTCLKLRRRSPYHFSPKWPSCGLAPPSQLKASLTCWSVFVPLGIWTKELCLETVLEKL